MNFIKRQRKLLELLEPKSLDAFLVKRKQNIFYLTGARGEDSVLFASSKGMFLVTDPRYGQEYSRTAKNCKLEISEPRNLHEVVRGISVKMRARYLGFESNGFSYSEYADLKKGLKNTRLIPEKDLIESLRAVKDDEEIRRIKKACKDSCDIMDYALRIIAPRSREISLRNRLEIYIQKKGLQKAGFDIIVASGRNAAMPHAPATDKNIKKGEVVIIDLGTRNCGYNSDLTRTIFLGRIDPKYLQVFSIVLDAQKKAIDSLKPGMEARTIDNISRQYISYRGLGRYFIHSLGHGIGLEVHEQPRLSRGNRTLLQKGMVMTVEPGVYIPGWGGVRIEDVALITQNSCEILTKRCERPLCKSI